MALTRPDIIIPAGTWVNLYAASGITVGTAVSVYNKSSAYCLLVVKATTPAPSTTMGVPLSTSAPGNFASVAAGEVGLWAYSSTTGILLVQE